MNILFIEYRSTDMLRYLYIKTWHGFVSNHSRCLGGVFKTHLNFKTIPSENFKLDEKTEEWRFDAYDCLGSVDFDYFYYH